ncbi:hypothetical protein ACFUN7_32160 [Streptomyces sp. NPDC057236]|uniref:hypothetical protein n=1 Tax=Streptomyces sp. NPDC057236 TaxID=3346059 RepID=UPI003641B392
MLGKQRQEERSVEPGGAPGLHDRGALEPLRLEQLERHVFRPALCTGQAVMLGAQRRAGVPEPTTVFDVRVLGPIAQADAACPPDSVTVLTGAGGFFPPSDRGLGFP